MAIILYDELRSGFGGTIVRGNEVSVDASSFSGNLDGNAIDVQALADAVDALTVGGGTGMAMASIGGIHLDIPTRVDIGTTLSGEHNVHFRVYNQQLVTSLNLVIDEGGVFQLIPLVSPTTNGSQSQTFNISTLSTSTNRQLVFYFIVNNNQVAGAYPVQVNNIEGSDVVIDRTSLSTVQGDDAQDMANELERLYGIVTQIQNQAPPSTRPLNTFENSVTITSGNVANFINRNSLYVRSDDARVNFVLPAESTIVGQYPAIFEVSHFGGTQRFDTGGGFEGPNNTIRITRPVDYDSSDTSTFLRRGSSTGANLVFSALHLGDTAIVRKESENDPWIIVESSTDPRSSILPDGVFQLNTRTVTFPTNINGDHLIGGLSLYTPNQGDAFVVSGSGITEDSTFGMSIDTGDVIVTKVDNPSLLLDENNNDWLIIRDAGNGTLTLRELRFLATVQETDTFVDTRLETRSDVSDARLWLSPFILDHAPFITPSTDTNNPQSGETGEYIGGDELDGADYDFRASATDIETFDGESGAVVASNAHIYLDIDGGINISENINDIFVVHLEQDNGVGLVEIARYNLSTDFRPITLTGSADTYYVYDNVGAIDNFSSINFHEGQTLNVILRTTTRTFNLGNSFDVLPSIKDNSISMDKLDRNTQALLTADHSLSDDQEAKLDGLETTGVSTPWTAGDLYVKANDHASSDLANYVNVGQGNGILSNFDSTRDVTFLVPNFVTVSGLQLVETPATKLSVTSIGTILDRQAFTATLPASNFNINNPVGDAWQVDGTASNLRLTGALPSFKIDSDNLDDALHDRIFSEPPTSNIPDVLRTLSNDLSVNTREESGWRTLSPPINSDLIREFSALWTEDRRTFTGNFFDDIADVEVIGFGGNNIFFYSDSSSSSNTSFPNRPSYILNSNVRVRNSGSGTNIEDVYNKVFAFEYSLQRRLASGENAESFDMVRLGSNSTHEFISISHDYGIALEIGNGDGGQQSRTYTRALNTVNGQLHDRVDESITAETEIVLPNDLTGSHTINIHVQLDNNGNDEGTHTEQITITNVGADQTIGSRTFSFGSEYPPISAPIRYEHNNTDLPIARRVIFLPWSDAFTNSALTYNVTADYEITETWNHPTSYARYAINSGDPHDRFGAFDPELWYTERLRTPEDVFVVLTKWRDTDTSSDPEMAVIVIVNGELKGSASDGYKIRLFRPKSDFDTSDVNFGNSACGVAHIQGYQYDADVPVTWQDSQTLYAHINEWLNAFTDADFRTDSFVLGADLELAQGEFFILRSANGDRFSITVEDDGTITTTKLT